MRHLLLTTALVLLAPAAFAQTIDEAGAQKLAQQLTAALKTQTGFELNGEATVKADGDAYLATLPTLTGKNPDGTLVISPIEMRLTPTTEGVYTFTGKLGTPMATMADEAGVPEASVSATEQSLSGTWDMNPDSPGSSYNFTASNLTVTKGQDTKLGTIATLAAKNTLLPVVDGKTGGDFNFSLTGLNFSEQQGQSGTFNVTLDKVAASGHTAGVDVKAIAATRDNVKQLNDSAIPTMAEVQKLLQGFASTPSIGSGQGYVDISLGNLKVNETKPEGSSGVSLGNFALRLDFSEAPEKLNNMLIAYSHNGLKITGGKPDVTDGVIPSAASFRTEVTNMPIEKLLGLTAGEAAKALDQPAKDISATAVGKDIWAEARKEMAAAKTGITVHDISYTAPALASKSTGSFAASAMSIFGASGKLDTRITGMEELLKAVTDSMNAPPAHDSNQPEAQSNAGGLMMALSMAQGFGRKVEGQTPSAYDYALELTPEGSFRLNGMDMGAMMGMGQQPSGGAPEPAPVPQAK